MCRENGWDKLTHRFSNRWNVIVYEAFKLKSISPGKYELRVRDLRRNDKYQSNCGIVLASTRQAKTFLGPVDVDESATPRSADRNVRFALRYDVYSSDMCYFSTNANGQIRLSGPVKII